MQHPTSFLRVQRPSGDNHAGGLYGNARPENFPLINYYRNPIIAGAMKTLGYVNKYNRGIGQVRKELSENGNPDAEYNVNLLTAFSVTVRKGTSQGRKGHKLGTSQVYQSEAKSVPVEDKKGTSRVPVEGTSRDKTEHRPFGPKVLTLQERIVEFCATPKSLHEIADFLGASNKKKVKARYIDNILGTKIIIPTSGMRHPK